MDRYERALRAQGFSRVAGVDEAGRGALAGPLVAAAVILPEGFDLEGIRDSKQLSAQQRSEAFHRINHGAVVAVVDIGNAGCGTRATDLTTLLWHTFHEPLDGVRERLWERILAVVGWEGAAVLTVTQVLLQLEWPIRLARRELVRGTVARGCRALDELNGLR